MNTDGWIFLILAGLMTSLAMLFTILPWLRARNNNDIDRKNINIAIYRDRLAELETVLDYPNLTFAQREQERQQLVQEFVDETDNSSEQNINTRVTHEKWAVFIISLGLPLLAVLIYFIIGAESKFLFQEANTNSDQEKIVNFEQMVNKLAARLAADPNNLTGWMMLGRSYMALERYAEAAKAYSQAYSLEGDKNAEVGVNYAEALVMANDNNLTARAKNILEQALTLEPNNHHGLWLAGIWAFQEQHYQVAIDVWQRLKSLLPQDSEINQEIEDFIKKAQDALK